MRANREVVSAIAVRLGIGASGVLGGFAGYWIGTISTPAGEVRPWMVGAGAVAGCATAWAGLRWLARRHWGAGIIAGGVLTIAAAAALIARFT
jgi:hypothetical protein